MDGKEPGTLRKRVYRFGQEVPCVQRRSEEARCAEIEDDIYAYAEENSVKSIDEIVTYFGAPETVAESFIDPGQNGEIRRRTSLKRAFIAFVCIIAMLLGAFLTTTYVDSHRSNYGYVDNEVHERAAIEIPVFVIQ